MGAVQGGTVRPLERDDAEDGPGPGPGWARSGAGSFKLTMAQLREYLDGAGVGGGGWGDEVGWRLGAGGGDGPGEEEATEPSERGQGDSPRAERGGCREDAWGGSRRADSDDSDDALGRADTETGSCGGDMPGDMPGDMASLFSQERARMAKGQGARARMAEKRGGRRRGKEQGRGWRGAALPMIASEAAAACLHPKLRTMRSLADLVVP